MMGTKEDLKTWITGLMIKQSLIVLEAYSWSLEGHLWMTLTTLGWITEEQFLEVRQGIKHVIKQKQKKKPKRQVYKRTHYLMSALVTLENTSFFYNVQAWPLLHCLKKCYHHSPGYKGHFQKKHSSFWGQRHLERLEWEHERGLSTATWQNDLTHPQYNRPRDFQTRDLVVG